MSDPIGPPSGSGAEHAGELLSALVDGELTWDEQSRVRGHLDNCPVCADELVLLERSRALIRSLPELDPPENFIEGIVRRRHRALLYGSVGGLMAAVVAAVFAITLGMVPEDRVGPELSALADDHSSTAVTAPETPTRSDSASFDGVRVDSRVAGFDLVAVSQDDEIVHALYRREGQMVSLFSQSGELDWGALPDQGERARLGDREVWQASDGSSTVVDTEGAVVVLVGGDTQLRYEMAAEVTGRPASLWHRAHDAAQTVLGAFDFG